MALAFAYRMPVVAVVATSLHVAPCLSAAAAAEIRPAAAWGMPWTNVPSITILATDNDPRVSLMRDAVAFWNRTFAEIGSPFRLGSVTTARGEISAVELAAIGERVLSHSGRADLPANLSRWPGQIVVALSDGGFVSFAARWPRHDKALVGIRSMQIFPLTLPNVARNVIAHELGHVIGLAHNSDPNTLMCGRPASCRPAVFASQTTRYFPLTADEKAQLLVLYPANRPTR
jgi:hypothetical protein